jgi:NADPH-dependent curcumin reductase CurA
MPALPPGGVLLRVLFVSLDPYMRGRMGATESYAKPAEIGDVMPGAGVAEVIASDHPGYAQGEIVLAPTGWRTHAASNGQQPGMRPARASRDQEQKACYRQYTADFLPRNIHPNIM